MKRISLFILFACCRIHSHGQAFEDISPMGGLPIESTPNVIIGDMDDDGDADIVLTGYYTTTILLNDGLDFTHKIVLDDYQGETQLLFQTLDLGDYDRDGTLDILQTGGPNRRVFYVLGNKDLTFTNLAEDWPGVAGASFFGDYENDGDLDIIISGADEFSNSIGRILLNENLTLRYKYGFPLYPTIFAGWADIDGDSKMEVLQSSASQYSIQGTVLYEQENLESQTPGLQLPVDERVYGAIFADYDNDGDIDLLTNQFKNFYLYDNEGGNFVYTGLSFSGRYAAWADMDNDGYYDIIFGSVEETYNEFETRIYINNKAKGFTQLQNSGLEGTELTPIAVGDLDYDGDLDVAVAGATWGATSVLGKIYKNNSSIVAPNTPPLAPSDLQQVVNNTSVNLTWSASTDDKTPQKGLTYNLSVTKDNGDIIVPSHSHDDGKRKLYKTGNAFNNTFFQLNCLREGTYKWKVQAIDAGLAGSPFSTEKTFTVTNTAPATPANAALAALTDRQIKLTWVDGINESEYVVYRRTVSNPYSTFDEPIASVGQNSEEFIDTLYLEPYTEYEYKLVASNCAYPEDFYVLLSGSTYPEALGDDGWLDLGEHQGSFTSLADVDNDGDLDLLYTYIGFTEKKSHLLYFNGEGFVDSGISFPYLLSASASWIDLNTDGYLDLFISEPHGSEETFELYLNQKGKSFSRTALQVNGELPHIWGKGVAWADYDNDGDDDMLLQMAEDGWEWNLRILKNIGELKFEDAKTVGLEGYTHSDEPWADYDNDGDLDILVNKWLSCESAEDGILENKDNNTFVFKGLGLLGLNNDLSSNTGDAQWGDFNNDGFADIILSGRNTCSNGDGMTAIYKNNGNRSFSPITTGGLTRQTADVYVKWGDYDNDGDPDIYMYGDPFGGPFSSATRIYDNLGDGHFAESDINYLIRSNSNGSATVGDIDNDKDLDFIVIGELDYTTLKNVAYTNRIADKWGRPNQVPSPPSSLNSTINGDEVTLSWNDGYDAETPTPGLTYQIYLINEGDTVVVSNSHQDGTRKVTEVGNARHRKFYTLRNIKGGRYRWSVQAIDAGYSGSVFAEEVTFNVPITEIDKRRDLIVTLFPVPANNGQTQLRISSTYVGPVSISVIDVAGRQKRQYSVTKHTVDWQYPIEIDQSESGMLLLKIQMGDSVVIKRLLSD